MEYLVIILVVALALAPLSHFAPSKRQRAVARMRESAALRGLFVEFRQLPGHRAPQARAAGRASEGVIFYGKRLPPARGGAPQRGSWNQSEDGWRSARGVEAAPDILRQLPADVLAASVDEGSCGIYWRESGNPEQLVDIIDVIEQWALSLRPRED
jgi:hypothetical protein